MAGPFDDLPDTTPAAAQAAPAATSANPFDHLPDEPKTGFGRAIRYADNIVRQVANGATFGFADELAAGADTALSPLTGSDKTYAQRVGDERDRDKAFHASNPIAATAAELAGALAGPGKFLFANRAVQAVPTVVGKTIAGSALGGGLGGFGSGEGGVEARLGSAGRGTLLGAALGLGFGGAGAVADRGLPLLGDAADGLGSVAKTLLGKYDADGRALAKIGQKIEDSGTTPDAIASLIRPRDMGAESGKPLSLLDVGGEQVQRLGRTISDMPGPGSSQIKQFLLDRDLGTGANPLTRTGGASDRIAGDLEQTFGDKLFHATDDALMNAQKKAADPLYAAFEKNAPVPASTFADFLGRPAIQDALKKAQRLAKNEGVEDLTRSFKVEPVTGDFRLTGIAIPPRTVDNIKKGLDDVIGAAQRTGESNDVRVLTGLKSDFLKAADDALPGYKAARDSWAGPAAARDALQAGRDAIRSDSEDVVRSFRQMTTGEQDLFRTGFKKALIDKMASTRDGADELKGIVGTPAMRERMQAILKPDEYGDLIGRLGTESTMYGTKGAILGNSTTAPRLADLASNMAADVTASIAKKGTLATALDYGVRKIAEAGGMTKRVADSTARFLTETDPTKIERILADIQAGRPSPAASTAMMKYGLNRQQITGALAQAAAENR